MKNAIKLSTEELLDLILEKTIQKENLTISSKSSLLAILALLEIETSLQLNYDRSTQS